MPGLLRQLADSRAPHLNSPSYRPVSPRTANGLNPDIPSIESLVPDNGQQSPLPVIPLQRAITDLKRCIEAFDRTHSMEGTHRNICAVRGLLRTAVGV